MYLSTLNMNYSPQMNRDMETAEPATLDRAFYQQMRKAELDNARLFKKLGRCELVAECVAGAWQYHWLAQKANRS